MPASDRKQASPTRVHELELGMARLRAILETARDAVVCIDHRGRITVFNPAAETLFGYTAAEMLGQNVNRLMGPPEAAMHDGYIQAYQQTGKAWAIGRIRRVEAQRRGGERFPMELSVAEAQVDGEVLYTAIIRDVTERERVDEAIRMRARQQATVAELGLRTLAGTSTSALMRDAVQRVTETLGVEYGEILELLPAGDTLLMRAGVGWPAQGFGKDTVSAHPDTEAGLTLASREPVIVDDLASERRFSGPARLAAAGVVSGMSVVILGSKARLGVLAVHTRSRRHFTTDDTHFLQAVANILATSIERFRAQDEMRALHDLARQRERLGDLGAIAAQVVHDLGNPVAALSLQVELLLRRLRREGAAPGNLADPAERIATEVRRLDKLVSDFKDFARQQRLSLSRIELASLLRAAVELWQPVAEAQRIDLAVHTAAGLPPIVGDESKLRRVLDNLIKNAVEAIDAGGNIRITASLHGRDRVRVSVSDSGAGVRPGTRLFRLFETTKPGGTGLGLAVARQIALAHGGDLTAEPGEPGGTVFHLDLPVQAASVF